MRSLARAFSALALRCVPREWRDTVAGDLDDEALRSGRSGWWIGCQAIAAGMRLRPVVNGDVMWTDLRYAVRSLLQARWFAIGAVLTFALGIGVNVAVFSAVDRMMFRALPYDHPERLVVMREFGAQPVQAYGTLPATYVAEARRLDAVVDASMSGWNSLNFTLEPEPGDDAAFSLSQATFNTLSVLGVRPWSGRDFMEADARAENRVALISYEVWKSRFAGRQDILGLQLWNARKSTVIVGVLPPQFINATSFLNPKSDGLYLEFDLFAPTSPRERAVPPTVRLKPGVTIEVAQAQVEAMVSRLRQTEPALPPGRLPSAIRLTSLDELLFAKYNPYLWLVMSASALVFLVACANLSSLMMVRGRSRERQFAVHLALGASRGRLIRRALVEALCLAGAGGAVAVVVLALSGSALARVIPPVFSRYAAGLVDLRVVIALAGCAVAGAVVAAIGPGLRAGRVDIIATLQQQGGRTSSRRLGGRSLLLVEAVVCMLLVAGAAATARSLVGLLTVDLGYEPRALYGIGVFLPPLKDPAANFEQYMKVESVLRSVLGSSVASSSNALPMDGSRPEQLVEGLASGSRYRVGAGLLNTLGARVIAGRLIRPDEVAARARVGVLNKSAVSLIWPDLTPQQAVGRLLESKGEAPFEIVGVVADMRDGPRGSGHEALFVPLDATKFRFVSYVARTADGKKPSLVAVRRQIKAAGFEPRSVSIGDFAVTQSNSLRDDRFRAALFMTFGVIALALAVVGLFSVASFEVALRRREMGVRVALGATPMALSMLVVREAVRPVMLGAALGLLLAFWAGKFLQSFLTGVDARDPGTLIIVAGVLILTSSCAAWIPARRAARTDPATVLRAD